MDIEQVTSTSRSTSTSTSSSSKTSTWSPSPRLHPHHGDAAVTNSIPIQKPRAAMVEGSTSASPTGTGTGTNTTMNNSSNNSNNNNDDDAVIAAPAPTMSDTTEDVAKIPAEIPPDTKPANGAAQDSTRTAANHDANRSPNNHHDDDESDWGDEDSYEYEDEDDLAFSGFLAPTLVPATNTSSLHNKGAAAARANIVEEEVLPSKSEDSATMEDASCTSSSVPAAATAPAASESTDASPKRKWKEPSRAAVNMSLRAQSETTGGKRRLAQDLYKIMNQNTEDAGFSLQPKNEDSMDSWTIKLFQFDEDSNLAKDMQVLNIDHIELEMKFPDQYPFEPPFVRVVRPRFKRQTGFVMNGALCMELLTKDGWNPINDIESVIVSIRSLLVVGDGRLKAATELSETRYQGLLQIAAVRGKENADGSTPASKKTKLDGPDTEARVKPVTKEQAGSYTSSEAQFAYSHLSAYHKKKGWDTTGWWARKG